jgi:hypothetical protein
MFSYLFNVYLDSANYILLADMNSIDIIDLDSNGNSVNTVAYGQFYNSYTAIAYDARKDVIYYSDVNR